MDDEETLPLDEAKRIVEEARSHEVEPDHIAISEIAEITNTPLLLNKLSNALDISASGSTGFLRSYIITSQVTEDPIKHFNVQRIYGPLGILVIGLKGKFWMDVPNPTPFSSGASMKLRVVGDGFVFVDQTFSFDIPARSVDHITFSWSLNIWDMLVRAFWSLFSSETTCSGTLTVGSFSKDFDVTKSIPIEKA